MPKSVLGKRKSIIKPSMLKKKSKIVSSRPMIRTNERKYNDTTLNNTAITTAGIINNSSVNAPQVGSENYQRVGRKINLTSIHMRGSIVFPQQTSLTLMSTRIRIIVYLDNQANAAAATVGGLMGADIDSFRNLDNVDRFSILYDKMVECTKPSMTALAGPVYASPETRHDFPDLNRKVNIPIHFNSTNGGTVADCTSNNIGVLCIADVAVGAYIDGYFRIRYVDA